MLEVYISWRDCLVNHVVILIYEWNTPGFLFHVYSAHYIGMFRHNCHPQEYMIISYVLLRMAVLPKECVQYMWNKKSHVCYIRRLNIRSFCSVCGYITTFWINVFANTKVYLYRSLKQQHFVLWCKVPLKRMSFIQTHVLFRSYNCTFLKDRCANVSDFLHQTLYFFLTIEY